ncbi:hypothetical protein [Pedobacter ginsengisoli]|uniref:hypothetical protein n=1 Tax=Pedobacter ginsengisoli TaxID=363852 RepID=UPI00254F5D4F|nr:hypothetical protein [Pedobacter ginsengisoli]
MRILISLLFPLCYLTASAQSFKFPVVPAHGKTIKTLIPTQWKVIDSVYGDLNGDKIGDLALIFEFYASVKENRAYGDNTTELITEIQRPRILAIYFKTGRNYKLAIQNNDFILRSQEGGAMPDPLRPMSIRNEKLVLEFEGGGNWRWKLNYSFGYQGNEWRLIQARNYAYHISSGETNEKQYDFLNGTRKVISGKTGHDKTNNETHEGAFQVKTLRTLSSFKKPWTWEIGPDEYL